jgi:hypothetical protein
VGVRVELKRLFVVEFDIDEALITLGITKLLFFDVEFDDDELADPFVSTANRLANE